MKFMFSPDVILVVDWAQSTNQLTKLSLSHRLCEVYSVDACLDLRQFVPRTVCIL